jgi:hypothetical protein
MKKYYERIDELLTQYEGRGRLNVNSNGVYEFTLDRSGRDVLGYSGEDFMGIHTPRTFYYVPLSRLVFIEQFDFDRFD